MWFSFIKRIYHNSNQLNRCFKSFYIIMFNWTIWFSNKMISRIKYITANTCIFNKQTKNRNKILKLEQLSNTVPPNVLFQKRLKETENHTPHDKWLKQNATVCNSKIKQSVLLWAIATHRQTEWLIYRLYNSIKITTDDWTIWHHNVLQMVIKHEQHLHKSINNKLL